MSNIRLNNMNELPIGSTYSNRRNDEENGEHHEVQSFKVPWGPDGTIELTLPAELPVVARLHGTSSGGLSYDARQAARG